jgi:hypothetical protein
MSFFAKSINASYPTHCKCATHISNFDPMTSMYKKTNYVLDEIDLTSSFNFLLQVLQHLTLILKKRAISKKFYSNDTQDL